MARWLAEGAGRQAKGLTRSWFCLSFPLPLGSREWQTNTVDPGQESAEVAHTGSSVSPQGLSFLEPPVLPGCTLGFLRHLLSGAPKDENTCSCRHPHSFLQLQVLPCPVPVLRKNVALQGRHTHLPATQKGPCSSST